MKTPMTFFHSITLREKREGGRCRTRSRTTRNGCRSCFFLPTRPTKTGSGPVYSSITKNWFQTHPRLERWSTWPSLPLSQCLCKERWRRWPRSRGPEPLYIFAAAALHSAAPKHRKNTCSLSPSHILPTLSTSSGPSCSHPTCGYQGPERILETVSSGWRGLWRGLGGKDDTSLDLTSYAEMHHKVIFHLSFLTSPLSFSDSEKKEKKDTTGHMREYKQGIKI